MFDQDHIDPKWEEGRDYQMVCGLNCPLNLKTRDKTLNNRKSNRFLPWRVSQGDLGSIPVDPGDFCQFLDPDTGEWVLEEFMGEWWFEKTKTLCSASIVGRNNVASGHLKKIEGLGGKVTLRKKVGIFGRSKEQHSEDSRKAGRIGGKIGGRKGGLRSRTTKENLSRAGRIGGVKSMSTLYLDPEHPELGLRSAATLTRMQIARGLPCGAVNRVKSLQRD
jgi:hypothetical protein